VKLSVPSIKFYTRWERGKVGIEEDHNLLFWESRGSRTLEALVASDSSACIQAP